MTKRSPVRAILLLSVFVALAAAELPQPRAGILAVVNDKPITHQDVVGRLQKIEARFDDKTLAGILAGTKEQIHAEMLESLIHDELLLAEARLLINRHEFFKHKLEELLHDRIVRERQKAGGDAPYKELLDKQGITYDEHLKAARRQLMREIILSQFVDRNLSVTPQEVSAYYRQNLSFFQEVSCVRYRQIFVSVDKYPSREEAWQTVELVMDRLKKQHDFAKLVPLYSDGPRRAKGGQWESTRRGQRSEPIIDNAVFSVPVGEFSDPLETDSGFTIIKIEHREKVRTRPFEEVQEQIEKELLDKKRAARYEALIKRLTEKHYVKRFAAQVED